MSTARLATPSRHPFGPSTPPRPMSSSSNGTSPRSRPRSTTSSLSTPLLPLLRESFHLLDKDSDGTISPSDLLSMLVSLSLTDSPSSTTTSSPQVQSYFLSVPQPFNLPSYITHLTSLLGDLSSADELLTAFAAFDDTDNGFVDPQELKEALLNMPDVIESGGGGDGGGGSANLTAEEIERCMGGFKKKRGLGYSGERFNYRDWVGCILGKGNGGGGNE